MRPLIIVGPTASGKTALSLSLAERFGNCDILVADSKQVYREQDIVTGKDVPIQTSARIFGIDLVDPNQEWSIAHFLSYAKEVKDRAEKEERQLIIVGGTPLYTLSLFRAPQTAAITPDHALREELTSQSVVDLQKRLKKLHPGRFKRMNPSDQKNPRRLIRAIEIEIARSLETPTQESRLFLTLFSLEQSTWIGLQVPQEQLQERINARVRNRLAQGAVDEYRRLLANYPDWRSEAKSALGYFEIESYLQGKSTKEELVNTWTLHELQYAKRQMTWWKREPQIDWFEALDPSLQSQVLLALKDCYNGLK